MVRSSAWLMIGTPSDFAYFSALLINLPLATGEPSSVKPTAPASTMAPSSAMASPLRPTLIAPVGSTRQWPASLPRSIT